MPVWFYVGVKFYEIERKIPIHSMINMFSIIIVSERVFYINYHILLMIESISQLLIDRLTSVWRK